MSSSSPALPASSAASLSRACPARSVDNTVVVREFACDGDYPTYAAATLSTALKYLAVYPPFFDLFFTEDNDMVEQVGLIWFNIRGVVTADWFVGRFLTAALPTKCLQHRGGAPASSTGRARGIRGGLKRGRPGKRSSNSSVYGPEKIKLYYLVENYVTRDPKKAFGYSERKTYGTPHYPCTVAAKLPLLVRNLVFDEDFSGLFSFDDDDEVQQVRPLCTDPHVHRAEAERMSNLPSARSAICVFPSESEAQDPRSTSTQLAIRTDPSFYRV
ncbi:hypothetical protein DFH06DRAFT_1139512 [Mycena polygramma]|nr:hypothetical protein DFH06DRAFT_1152001 [Mycena polygramma]KAJ7635607.1 hypothetical protein DFH06DRAFT_1139512 [Mycena polygramma]